MQRQVIVSPRGYHEDGSTFTSKRRFKLQDPPVFTGGKDGMPVVEWLAKMKGKMTVDDDLMDTPWRRMAYVMSRVGGTAFGHLEPRARENGPRPWKDSNEMLAYLERVFGDSNRRRNAEYEFRYLHQTGDFNTFWAEFLRLSIKLDRNEATLISDLTHKLSVEMRLQLINGDKEPTDLFQYSERCRRVYQGLQEITRAEALEESMEQSVVVAPTPTQKVGTRSTIRTAKSSRQPVISEKDQLMKEGRCFSCREVGHRTMDCPSKKKLTIEQKPRNELTVSRMVVQELKPKESRTVVLEAIAPRAEESHAEPRAKEPLAEKPFIVSSSSLPGDLFAEKALVASCMLGNNGEIKTTALLDTGATGYSFVDPAMARRVCDDLAIEPIRLSKPKAIRGFDGKRAPDVTHAIYPTMTVQDHREMVTSMLITKLGQHQIILGKPWMRKHGVILDMRNDRLSFWPGHCQHTKPHAKPSHAEEPHKESNTKAPHADKQCAEKPRAAEPQKTILK